MNNNIMFRVSSVIFDSGLFEEYYAVIKYYYQD